MSEAHDNQPTRRVLIVEDIPRLREMLTRAIRDMDFIPTGVESGEAGLAALEKEPADIALVDLSLPGMNGLEFCEHVHRRWENTKLVILTGYGDLDAARKAIRLDVVDFLTKPCTLGDLEIALGRAMRHRHDTARLEGPAILGGDAPPETHQPGDADARTIEEVEREHILDTLARNDGNRAKTAKELGISLRTLYYRLSTYESRGEYKRE
jgi:DNA-binding NtrC family response regulator